MTTGRDYISLGRRAYGKSDESLWVVAFAAYHTDNYAEFGRALKRSRSTVSRWVRAIIVYNTLRNVASVGHIRKLRHSLTVTHFSRFAELWARYEFSPDKAIDYLELSVDNEWSPEAMAAEIEKAEEDAPYKDWIRFANGIRSWSEKLLDGYVPYDLPDEHKARAGYLAEGMAELARDVDKVRETWTS